MTKLPISLALLLIPLFCSSRDNQFNNYKTPGLTFLENKGQIKNKSGGTSVVDYIVEANGITIFISKGQLSYQFLYRESSWLYSKDILLPENATKNEKPADIQGYVMQMDLSGANKNAVATPLDPQEFVARYYSAAPTNKKDLKAPVTAIEAHSFGSVVYKDIYPGIDWLIYSKNGKLEYEFVVKPGADPALIKLKYSGVDELVINEDGSLKAVTPMGSITEAPPYCYDEKGNTIKASYTKTGNEVGFDIAQYNGTLTIDPSINWATYYGGTGDESYNAILYSGGIYVTGTTTSAANIAYGGVGQTTYSGQTDMFISNFNTSGILQWTSYYGTSGNDYSLSICQDQWWGDLLIAGYTDYNTDDDIAMAKFSTTGTLSTLNGAFGGNYTDRAYSIGFADFWNQGFCVSGITNDAAGTWSGILQANIGGDHDGFIAVYDDTGGLQTATYYGGPGLDYITTSSPISSWNYFAFAGITNSSSGLSITGTYAGGTDGFSAIADPYLSAIYGGEYIGGNGDDGVLGGYMPWGGGVITGFTSATSGIATAGTYQETYGGGGSDAFIMSFSGGSKQWGTYVGGTSEDIGYGAFGNSVIFMSGKTNSSSGIASPNAFQQTLGGGYDGFIASTDGYGTTGWGTYYGGSGNDVLNGVTYNSTTAYVAGQSNSPNNIATTGSYQPGIAGGNDAMLGAFCFSSGTMGNTVITGPDTVCGNGTSSYTYSIPSVTNAVSYSWTLPNGWTGSSTTNSIVAVPDSTSGTISIIVNLCDASNTITKNITVNSLHDPQITAGGPLSFCPGGNVIMSAPTSTGYTYQWYKNNSILTGATNPSYSAIVTGNYKVRVTQGTCVDTSNVLPVVTYPVPGTPVTTVSAPVCTGGTVTVTATSSLAAVYNWTGPVNHNTQNFTITNATLAESGTYTIITTSSDGCVSAPATATVVVFDAPPVAAYPISGPNQTCINNTGIYTTINPGDATSYTWTLPGGWVGTSNTNTINVTVGTTGGTVSVVPMNDCGTGPSINLQVAVDTLPVPIITQSGNELSTGIYTHYQWYLNGNIINGAVLQTYTANGPGDYSVIVRDDNGCYGTSSLYTYLNVESVTRDNGISVYPNPNFGNFNIEGTFRSDNGKVNLAVVDIAGRIVHKETIIIKGNAIDAIVNMNASFAPGMYTLKLNSDVETTVIPFVKK